MYSISLRMCPMTLLSLSLYIRFWSKQLKYSQCCHVHSCLAQACKPDLMIQQHWANLGAQNDQSCSIAEACCNFLLQDPLAMACMLPSRARRAVAIVQARIKMAQRSCPHETKIPLRTRSSAASLEMAELLLEAALLSNGMPCPASSVYPGRLSKRCWRYKL